MKKVKMVVTMTVTDEYYENELKQLSVDIDNGEHKAEMLKDTRERGVRDYDATLEVIEPQKEEDEEVN